VARRSPAILRAMRAGFVGAVLLLGGAFPPGAAARSLEATTPPLGAADSFGILSSTYTNTSAGTTITGDLGFTIGPAVAPTVSGTTYTPISPPGSTKDPSRNNFDKWAR